MAAPSECNLSYYDYLEEMIIQVHAVSVPHLILCFTLFALYLNDFRNKNSDFVSFISSVSRCTEVPRQM